MKNFRSFLLRVSFIVLLLVVYAFYLITKKYTLEKIQTSDKSIRNNYKPAHSNRTTQSTLVYAFLNSVCVYSDKFYRFPKKVPELKSLVL